MITLQVTRLNGKRASQAGIRSENCKIKFLTPNQIFFQYLQPNLKFKFNHFISFYMFNIINKS